MRSRSYNRYTLVGKYDIHIRKISSHALLIEWPQRIAEDILDEVVQLDQLIQEKYKGAMTNRTPAYASILIQFSSAIDEIEMKKEITAMYHDAQSAPKQINNSWHIPVCYNPLLAVDLSTFKKNNISHEELVKLHTQPVYRVYMIGFLPGFVYLGGLPDRLHLSRKSAPSLRTPSGSVAIGGQQTGIYPSESPGGWHVIGRTPLRLFDINADVPTPIRQGDTVQFYSINIETYKVLSD